MSAQGSGLTLEALAQKLETLQRENAERLEAQTNRLETLEQENTELRSKVATLEGSGTCRETLAEMRGSEPRLDEKPTSVFTGRVSRRSLLSKAGPAAVAAVAAGMLLNPREARATHEETASIHPRTVQTNWIFATNNIGAGPAVLGEATTSGDFEGYGAVQGKNLGSGPGVKGIATAISGAGVQGTANGSLGYGVKGEGFSGVWGESSHTDGRGVMGVNPNGTGVRGQGNTGVFGVGFDDQQAGVKGEGPTGVWGRTSKTHFAGVYGEHTGTSGNGVLGIGKGGEQGVFGKNPDNIGVRGDGKNGVYGESTTGNGWGAVVGRSTGRGGIGTYGECSGGTGVKGVSTSGYAGVFEGGKAQLKLKPAGSAGKPTSGTHAKGEIYMDSAGALFVCVASSTATAAAKWKKLSATAV